MSIDYGKLPAIPSAPLPDTYTAAKQALRECSRLDECKEWSDKTIALASYARQSQDESLLKLALRIKSRALRKAGEILDAIEKQQAGRPPKIGVGAGPNLSLRKQAAKDAGFSPRQHKDAIRIARVPEAQFETLVESADPPTTEALAELGTNPMPVNPVPAFAEHSERVGIVAFKAATQGYGKLSGFAQYCVRQDPEQVVLGMLPRERAEALMWARAISAWLEELKLSLEGYDGPE